MQRDSEDRNQSTTLNERGDPEQRSPSLRLQTLGGLKVYVGDSELTGMTSQPVRCAALAYLAVERRATRDELTGLLWPERSPDAARHALSQTIYRLRQDLGANWLDSLGDQLVVTPAVEVDVQAFTDAVDGGEFDSALTLYGGDFLAGTYVGETNAFENWVDRKRAELASLYRQANRAFLDDQLRGRHLTVALKTAHRWVESDPLQEDAQRYFIELLAASGQRMQALRQYDRYAKQLAHELELEPLDEIKALVAKIRAGAPVPTLALEVSAEAVGRGAKESDGSRKDSGAFKRKVCAPNALRAALADRYRIQRILGSGGMATVYLAEDLRHRRHVAIKVLYPELASGVAPERFLREIEIAAALTHPHIVPVHDSGEADGFLYYVMPYVQGESLRARLSREGALPIADALRIMKQIADALAHAHENGVVHRDIKPDNVMLCERHALVTDFGVAKAVMARSDSGNLTAANVALGTPAYMAPEQAAASSSVDDRADIYALGTVAYEMLAGSVPFLRTGAEATLAARLHETVPSISRHRSEVTSALEIAVMKCLHREPADRWPNASALVGALESIPTPTNGSHSVRRKPTRRMLLLGAVATAVALLAFPLAKTARYGPLRLSGTNIAIFPFAPTVRDTGLSRLGRDLVVTLSTNLDGVGDVRTIDPSTVLAQALEVETALTLEEASRLSIRLGASSFVHGRLIRIGERVRLDFGLFATDSSLQPARASVTARATVTGVHNDLVALTDSATWAILRHRWQGRDSPTPSLAAVATRSVPALRAFLEGERALVEGRWMPASRAFRRAFESDSTFWLAYWRHAYSARWVGLTVDSNIVNAYMSNRFAFPDRERLLIEMQGTQSVSSRLRLGKQLTEQFPHYWPARLEYADDLAHLAPFLGYRLADARRSFERVVNLNPRVIGAWQHLMHVQVQQQDTVAMMSTLDTLTSLGAWAAMAEGYGFDQRPRMQILYQLKTSGIADSSVIAAYAKDTRLIADLYGATKTLGHLLVHDYPAQEIEIIHLLRRGGIGPDLLLASYRTEALAWIARGGWHAALAAADTVDLLINDPRAKLDGYRVAVLGAWSGGLDPDEALRRRDHADHLRQLDATTGAEVAWLNGILAAAVGDVNGVRRAKRTVDASDAASASILAHSLAAVATYLGGDTAVAATSLAQLEWQRADQPGEHAADHPFLTSVNRLTAARWLREAGKPDEAGRLLRWYEAMLGNPSALYLANASMASLALVERARLATMIGNSRQAVSYYSAFLKRYDRPEASHRPLVEEARAALAVASKR